MTKLNRMFYDIETSPNVVLSWRTGYKLNIDHDNILNERAIICICWKWEGKKTVHSATWDRQHNDKAMLATFIKEADRADELVAHNGDRFDLPWVITRCAAHGLPTFPSYKTVDTLQWARRKFYFNSNRLDYIGRFFGLGSKIKTDFGLWKSIVLHKDRDALRRMVLYCKRDVELLEQIWGKLAAHVPHKTHVGVANGGPVWGCPHCGSERVIKTKTRVTAKGVTQHQMRCKGAKCNRYYSISDSAYRKYAKPR